MSKQNFMFNAEKNLTAPAGSVDELLYVVDTITVYGVQAPLEGTIENYSAHVAFVKPGATGDSSVIWAMLPGASNTGTAVLDQRGVIDFTAAKSGDVYALACESCYGMNNDEGSSNVMTSPSIDGGRIGASAGQVGDSNGPLVFGSHTITVA